MAYVLEIPSFDWKDMQQGLELCKAIQSNPFDVIITISSIVTEDSYRILLLTDKPVTAQVVNLPCNEFPSNPDLDTLVDLAIEGALDGLTGSIAKTGLSIRTDYPNIPAFEACDVDENCAAGFDPKNPIISNIPQTIELMENIHQMGGGSNGVAVIVGLPKYPFDPRP